MSAIPMCENPCETCAKQGLPLLLTRYALMPAELNTPRLFGDLNAPELGEVPLGSTAHYGLRLLRSGYVYVFDEKRSHWDEYFVTTDGFLTKLPMRTVVRIRQQPAAEFQCARNGAAPLAGVITIRNARHAGAIWIAFSDVEWTDRIFTAHQDAAHRQKHMRRITVAAGKVAAQPGTAPLEQVDQLVPEFKLDGRRATEQFGRASPYAFNARQGSASALLQAAEQVRPGGGAAIVALHDPVGLALEIAMLADLRKSTFMDHEAVAKPRIAASTIASLQATIRAQAELELMDDLDMHAQIISKTDAGRQSAARLRAQTPAALQRAGEHAWRRYTHDRTGKPRVDDAASREWLKTYNTELEKFDAEQIAPLARAHVAWMQHRCMVNYMVASYDSADAHSGVAYTATVFDLLCRTVDKQPSYELYLSWLRSGEFTERNLVMRALGLNQDELIAKLKEADAATVSARAFPSDAVVGAVAVFLEKMPPGAKQRLAALMAGLSGPALKYWSDFADGKAAGKAAAALAAVTGKQIVRLNITGTLGDFVQEHMRMLKTLDPSLKTNNDKLQKAIARQRRLLQIKGVNLDSKGTLGWYVLLDKDVVAAATAKGLSGQDLADELAKAIRTPQDVYQLDLASRGPRLLAKGALVGTALSGVLMLVNYTKLMEDVKNAMGHEKGEAQAKLWLGTAALGGFVAEQVGTLLEKVGEQRLRNAPGLSAIKWGERLARLGRIAGFGAGLIVGLWDVWKGANEDKQGDSGLANAYYVSGVSGIAVAGTMFSVSMGWIALGIGGWIFLAAGIAIWLVATWYVEAKKDNRMHEWLRRCHFGTAPEGEKFHDVEDHVAEHKLALAG